ncbi:hypothetical protein Krac_8741 [Ktedonobacter racemifer DSM 44963]|uniref:Uncharacterized protein n=1 Tax=Ktedonobacter racemifer DSM 44963 TaxID=485913 RepID=D6TP54_KTERA|nr:hypothetical protein Krac_8741 [Ktedonobacter racemifer DSM 44963]
MWDGNAKGISIPHPLTLRSVADAENTLEQETKVFTSLYSICLLMELWPQSHRYNTFRAHYIFMCTYTELKKQHML